MGSERFGDDLAHGHAGVEAGQRVLKHHLDIGAVFQHLARGKRQKVRLPPPDGLAGRRNHLDQRAGQRGLAAAGFADDAQGFARLQGKIHAADGMKQARRRPGQVARAAQFETDAQVADVEEGRGHARSSTLRLQARQRPGANSLSGCRWSRQSSPAWPQRGAKGQPFGAAVMLGGDPGME